MLITIKLVPVIYLNQLSKAEKKIKKISILAKIVNIKYVTKYSKY